MTHLWQQTITINKNLARQLIETQHRLPIHSIHILDEGWDNIVYLVNHHFIFRFPRREFGVFCMENEIALLPFIAQQVSFPLSCPQWVGQPCEQYPYPFSGYTLIPGKPLCYATTELISDQHFATTMAHWLKQLHAITVNEAHATIIKGDQNWRLDVNHRISRCHENIARYEHYFLQAGFETTALIDIIASLNESVFTPTKRGYLHGDLYSRHVIVNPKNLSPTGLIDWGDVHLGPPGIDLAIGMVLTEAALDTFLNTYGSVDKKTLQIMRFHSFCHVMSFLPYAYEQNKSSLQCWAALVLARAIQEIKKYR